MEALEAIADAFARSPRVTIISPCGSRKTLVERETASSYSKVLIIAPSLALIAQSLAAVRACAVTDGRTVLCVDLVQTRTTLAGATSICVFCTYQSANLLIEALPPAYRFDLAICDEAHRTAGAVDRAL